MPDTRLAFGATDALLLMMAVIWGVNYTAVKYAGLAFSPVSFTFLRVAVAMITLAGAAALRRRPAPSRRDVVALHGLGVFGNGIYQLLFVSGVARTRVADAALIVAAAPAFIALASRFRGVERIGARALAGIALSVAGVGVVMLGSATTQHGARSLAGSLMVFAGVLCWSTFTVALQPFTRRIDAVQLNAITMTGGMIPLVFLIPHVVRATAWPSIPLMAWGALAYSAVGAIALAYLFWYRGIRVLGPTRTAVYANLQPVVAIFVGWALLGESPTLWQIAGTVTILSGIFLTRA